MFFFFFVASLQCMSSLQASVLPEAGEILQILQRIELEGLFFTHDKLAIRQVRFLCSQPFYYYYSIYIRAMCVLLERASVGEVRRRDVVQGADRRHCQVFLLFVVVVGANHDGNIGLRKRFYGEHSPSAAGAAAAAAAATSGPVAVTGRRVERRGLPFFAAAATSSSARLSRAGGAASPTASSTTAAATLATERISPPGEPASASCFDGRSPAPAAGGSGSDPRQQPAAGRRVGQEQARRHQGRQDHEAERALGTKTDMLTACPNQSSTIPFIICRALL